MQKKSKFFSIFLSICLITSIILIALSIPKVSATTIFSDGFESGTILTTDTPAGAWSADIGSISIVTTPVHTGTYAFQVASSGWVRETGLNLATADVRVYVSFPVLPTSGNYVTFLGLGDFYVKCYNNSGTMNWGVQYSNGTSSYVAGTIVKNTWYCIEINRTVGASSTGINILWVDGNIVKSNTAVTVTGNATLIQVGVDYLSGGSATMVYDDAAISTSYIGLMPTTVPITFTSSPTGSGYITVNGSAQTTPYTISTANIGDVYIIAAVSPVRIGWGNQYIYSSWSDAGAQSHTYTVSAAATVTATFNQQLKSLNLGNSSIPANQISSVGLGGTYVSPSQVQNVGGIP